MEELNIANINDSGNLKLPDEILTFLKDNNITKFLIFFDKDILTLKPIISNNKEQFLKLAEESYEYISKTEIKEEDLPKIINDVRNEYSS